MPCEYIFNNIKSVIDLICIYIFTNSFFNFGLYTQKKAKETNNKTVIFSSLVLDLCKF